MMTLDLATAPDHAASTHWQTSLHGATPYLTILSDFPRSHGGTNTAVERRGITGGLAALVRSRADEASITLATAVQIVLSRHRGDDDVVIGLTMPGVGGMMPEVLPLRLTLADDPTFRTALERTTTAFAVGAAHRPVSLTAFKAALPPIISEAALPAPLCAVRVLASATDAPIERAGADVVVAVALGETAPALHAAYDPTLFGPATIGRLLGHIEAVLCAGLSRPDEPVSVIDLLTEAERGDLDRFNETAQAYDATTATPGLVMARAAATPDALAVRMGAVALTYKELDERSTVLARRLVGLGVGADAPVGLCLERSPAMIVGALAIMKAGGAYLPLDPGHPDERLDYMLGDAAAGVVLAAPRPAARLTGDARTIIVLDERGAAGDEDETASDGDIVLPAIAPDDLAYIVYTSGSTGAPKGVEISHRALLNLIWWHRGAFDVTAADRATQVSGPGFDAAVWEVWPYLTAGAALDAPDDETRAAPEALRDWMVHHEITISFLPTVLAESVLALSWPEETRLRTLLTGADTLHSYPVAALPFVLVNNYGPSECAVVTTSGRVDAEDAANGLGPALGKAIANTRLYVLDARGRRTPVGVDGDLYVGGDGLARGYHNRPDLTAAAFVPHPFSSDPHARLYRTGDLVRLRADGSIEFRGRRDSQVKLRGFRIELDEVAAALNAHSTVATSVVVVREDTPGEKLLVAYVARRGDAHPTAALLHEAAAATLAPYMLPAAYVVLDALPLTTNGKIDRAALPAPLVDVGDAGDARPRTPVEECIGDILATLLKRDWIALDDNFFLLGGHSLLGTQAIARIRDAFDVAVSLRTLFAYPTIEDISEVVEDLIMERLVSMSDEEAARLLGAAEGVA